MLTLSSNICHVLLGSETGWENKQTFNAIRDVSRVNLSRASLHWELPSLVCQNIMPRTRSPDHFRDTIEMKHGFGVKVVLCLASSHLTLQDQIEQTLIYRCADVIKPMRAFPFVVWIFYLQMLCKLSISRSFRQRFSWQRRH